MASAALLKSARSASIESPETCARAGCPGGVSWLASKAEFAMAARKSGRNYTQLIEELVELAVARYGAAS